MTQAPLWQKAASFAATAHRRQRRRDGRTPYFAHPARVALTVATAFSCTDEVVLAAALLHDVIEDTPTDYDELLQEFGPQVADLVAALSKDKRAVEGDREAAYDRQLAGGPWQARLIKLADVYDNLLDADDDRARRKLLATAKRALGLAEGDARLKGASQIVRGLTEGTEARLAAR